MGCLLAGLAFFLTGLPSVWAQAAPAADIKELRAKAEHEDLEAQNALGNAYTNALLGVKVDYAEAYRWYLQAAEKGFAPAQFNLGLAFELGRGMPADDRQAFKYYLMAAEQGFAAAQFNVGNMHLTGHGVGQDLFEANGWRAKPPKRACSRRSSISGLAYDTTGSRSQGRGAGQPAGPGKQAADRGFARAQYNLGLLLEDGRGVPNDVAAAAFYRAAAEQGFAPAQNNYGLMSPRPAAGLVKDCRALPQIGSASRRRTVPILPPKTSSPDPFADQLAAAKQQLADRKSGKPLLVAAALGSGHGTCPFGAGFWYFRRPQRLSPPRTIPPWPT